MFMVERGARVDQGGGGSSSFSASAASRVAMKGSGPLLTMSSSFQAYFLTTGTTKLSSPMGAVG